MVVGETIAVIASEADIVAAREEGRVLARHLGFSFTESTRVATAISELARNILLHAKRGEIVLKPLEEAGRKGILVIARDEGPGIADVERAASGHYSASGGLGLGLAGVKLLMDEFEIVSARAGTTVTVKKWSNPSRR